MHPAQRHGASRRRRVGRLCRRLAIDLGLVDHRPAQEARFLVGVILNDLQRQTNRFRATVA
jgi:hypothetical protein